MKAFFGGLTGSRFFCSLIRKILRTYLSYFLDMKFLLAKKLGMTTLHDVERGARNITLLECDANTVSLVREAGRDGYSALQVETPKTKRRNIRREFRLDRHLSSEEVTKKMQELPVGATLSVDIFSVGDRVRVSGITKAKGFQGVVKRHGFKGAPKTHGHKHDLRAPGSIGATFPQHVTKGMRMAGRMGGTRSTSENLRVEYIDPEKRLIGVRGAVPGIPGSVVEVVLV